MRIKSPMTLTEIDGEQTFIPAVVLDLALDSWTSDECTDDPDHRTVPLSELDYERAVALGYEVCE